MTIPLQTHRFNVEDFHRMVQAGILKEDDRVELIDGEIVKMTPIGKDHAFTVLRLTNLLVPRVGPGALVNVQNPLRLGRHHELYPDVVLLRPPLERYAARMPEPPDVFLLIEVSDSTLDYDRSVRLPRYAEAGVPEVWLVNLPEACIEVHRDSAPEGYRSKHLFRRGDRIHAAALPGLVIAVDEILSA